MISSNYKEIDNNNNWIFVIYLNNNLVFEYDWICVYMNMIIYEYIIIIMRMNDYEIYKSNFENQVDILLF